MPPSIHQPDINYIHPLLADAFGYWIDRAQRHILFWDILRKRGNAYLDHYAAGQPPVLVFDYERVMDARTFDEPVNYALIRIVERRESKGRRRRKRGGERRLTHHGKAMDAEGRPARPIVVIDPRAGHGPGIGGSKLSSQIGEALAYGHPVYFILFYTNPEPGQTIARVQKAEIRFLEEVAARHPDAPKPAVIGNCQAGWAAALIGADRPDVTGPMVLNGSPLSYWGGVEGANPMRYKGGLLGGIWVTSLWCDLGYGRFDGAHLVAGFEDLNPANTYWSKYYHLFSNIDTEEKRFLDFEKWWGGYFKMTAEEIRFIIDELFIGNELEQGHLRLDERKVVNLKNFKEPILVFASGGDNITPPPQALNWIYKVYGTVEEIKRCGQVIIYMVHNDVGHLGIFVSGKLARKEHRQILGHIGWLEYLTPGLYEMVIEEGRTAAGCNDYQVRFEAREMADLLQLDDGLEDEDAFVPVNSVSRFNDLIYRSFFSPWVKLAATPPMDSWIRTCHPLRVQHYTLSDRNPLCWPVKWAAERVATQRRPVSADNAFIAWENCFSEATKIGLDYYREMRDLSQEYLFKAIYGNPWIRSVFGGQPLPHPKSNTRRRNLEKKRAHELVRKGGYVEACIRVMIAISGADRIMNDREFEMAEKIVQKDRRLRAVPTDEIKAMIKEQARVLDLDPAEAIGDLAALVPAAKDRRQLLDIARKLARADDRPDESKKGMLEAIAEALAL